MELIKEYNNPIIGKDEKSDSPAYKTKRGKLKFWDKPREVWIGLYVGVITCGILHNAFSYVILNNTLSPNYAGFLAFVLLVDVLIIIPLYVLANKGLSETEIPEEPEPPGSWGVPKLAFFAFLFYFGIIWTIDSYYKQLTGFPNCKGINNGTDTCSWKRHELQFYIHAIPGPIVLCIGVFNIMKFSRGLVFPISWHIWLGRIANIACFISAVGANILPVRVGAMPEWVRIGFMAMGIAWGLSAAIGWYFVRMKNILQHARWMTRNFSLTIAAITIRAYSIFHIGKTPYWWMIYAAIAHPIIIEIYLQYQNKCDVEYVCHLLDMIVNIIKPQVTVTSNSNTATV